MSIVRVGSSPTLLRARTVATETDVASARRLDGLEGGREPGEWGEIVEVKRITQPIDVVGLLAPDGPEAKATAGFTYAAKSGAGVELSLGIATLGVKVSYALEDGLEIPGEDGSASVGTLLLPVERITQRFRPEGSAEWFERWRYELVMLDPVYPNLGAAARSVPPEELLEKRRHPGTQVGGSAPMNRSTSRSVEVEVSLEIGLPLSDAAKPPTMTLSASLTGSVSVELGYELPANAGHELFWLERMAGGCFIPMK